MGARQTIALTRLSPMQRAAKEFLLRWIFNGCLLAMRPAQYCWVLPFGLSNVFCVQRWQLLLPSQSHHVADSYVKDVSAPQKAEQTQVCTENSVSNIRY